MGSNARDSLASVFKIILVIALTFALTFSLGAAEEASPSDQEYRIYSAVIRDQLLVANPGFINISDQTEYPDFMARLLKVNPAFSKGLALLENGTLNSFIGQNSRHYPLQKRFNLSIEYALLNEKNEPYATQIAGFSGVRLSPDGDQALLLLDHLAIWDVREGIFVLLDKVDGVWRVKAIKIAYLGEYKKADNIPILFMLC
jgi:hypothetical protein